MLTVANVDKHDSLRAGNNHSSEEGPRGDGGRCPCDNHKQASEHGRHQSFSLDSVCAGWLCGVGLPESCFSSLVLRVTPVSPGWSY